MKDLFEYYQDQPENLKKICDKWSEKINEGLTYKDCELFLNEVENIGYTFDYELSAEPFNLRIMDFERHEDDFNGLLTGDFNEEDINNKPPKKNYTGLTFGLPASTPTHINLFLKGELIERVELWNTNNTGQQVRNKLKRERKRLELKLNNLKKTTT
ncbi:hypothetical protein [Thalassobellus suaedae]|uniref:Uncharacterized protein n=1 Tax=Thalassobellus suaedae TaxID=3074124 RepID=A0ABY9XWA5_9FLAO|nr:hypothetical protein RHP51_05110 [Flavobacteriaceae bacterium HL-DH14]